jgi:phosphatidylserine/phosphatidylglycerophosphate/cardiolipin synthase-like enzyme
MAAHRFSNGSLIKMIKENLQRRGFQASLIVDDDLHWAGIFNKDFGRNTLYEFQKLMELEDLGLEIEYIETYADKVNEPKSLQLQHNKFIIFTKKNKVGTILTGAGNLTNAAFYRNFENFYLISIPNIYQKFLKQYDYLSDLGRSYQELPIRLELPK